MWALILGSALNTLGLFITIPIINIYAVDAFHLSAVQIGFISGIWPGTVFCMSFFTGMLAQRRGYVDTLRGGTAVNGLSFLLMTFASNISIFCFSLFLLGLGKAMADSSSRAAIRYLSSTGDSERYFRLRYLLQNVSCVIGPLIGVAAYRFIYGKTFLISMLMFLVYLIITFTGLRRRDFKNESNDQPSILKNFSVLKDGSLQLWIMSGTCILIAYGAYESLMPVVILNAHGTRPNYGFLVSLNAIVVILIQLGHLKLFKNSSLRRSILFGFILLAAGFALYAIEWEPYVMTVIATIVVSIGESVLFPCFDVVMGRISPDNKSALYYGAGELRQVGFFLGPSIGGLLLAYGGPVSLFIASALSIIVAGVLFNRVAFFGSNQNSDYDTKQM
ncbi:MFS transporter [Alicyclobacillus suci]|nr:MFS transporter [Alicyclobacillus suci]